MSERDGDKHKLKPGLLMCGAFLVMLVETALYSLAFAGPSYCIWRMRHFNLFVLLLTAVVGWYAATFVFVCLVVVIFRMFIGRLPCGRFFLTSRSLRKWTVACLLMQLVWRSPFASLLNDNIFFRHFFYRGMGADIDWTLMMGPGVRIPEPCLVKVGRHVILGQEAMIAGHKGEHDIVTVGPVEIGDNVLIGARAVIFPDVTIGSGATVGANSVVSRGTVIPPGETWTGNPAHKVDLFGGMAERGSKLQEVGLPFPEKLRSPKQEAIVVVDHTRNC